jgi:ATP-dependent DNA helicase RecG
MEQLLAGGEILTVEFKIDLKALPERDLIAADVVLAKTGGGVLLLGVEDNGEDPGFYDIRPT